MIVFIVLFFLSLFSSLVDVTSDMLRQGCNFGSGFGLVVWCGGDVAMLEEEGKGVEGCVLAVRRYME